MIKISSIYEDPGFEIGLRIMVDKKWPENISKNSARIDLWMKELAPSTELVNWLEQNNDSWDVFHSKYMEEIKNNKQSINQMKILERFNHTITLVHSDKNNEHNSAVVLAEFLNKPQKVIISNISRIHG